MECLTQEQLEARKQSEKDRAVLLSQMKVFEAELEEQLSRHEACAKQAEELSALRQQLAALDKHLRSQRQFMDVSTWARLSLWPRSHPHSVRSHDTTLGSRAARLLWSRRCLVLISGVVDVCDVRLRGPLMGMAWGPPSAQAAGPACPAPGRRL